MIKITHGKGFSIREDVLRMFNEVSPAVMTCTQIYEQVMTVDSRTDLADALRQMALAGDLEYGDERQPGEPGGMAKGSGARAVKTYRLPVITAAEAEKLESVLAAELDPAPVAQDKIDPLFDVIDQLPLAVCVPDGMQRAARLRRLAGRLEVAAPDLAAELYEDASILEDLAA